MKDTPIVGCACLQQYEWMYDGIPLCVGRPEVVTTIPEYRHRGLTRALFTDLHHKSQQKGHHLQAIVGIPHFYRKLGYEYALDLGGTCIFPISLLPHRTEKQQLPSILREATQADIPFMQSCYNRRCSRNLVSSSIPEETWRYYIDSRKERPAYDPIRNVQIITDIHGKACGFVLTSAVRWWKRLEIFALELTEDVDWFEIIPSMLQALKYYGCSMPTENENTSPLAEIAFTLGRTHPVYEILRAEEYPMRWKQPDGWFIRIPNMPKLLMHIAPALQRRIDASPVLRMYTGILNIDTYTGGVRLVFEKGQFLGAEPWKRAVYVNDADAHIHPQMLWQLILGYRSIQELRSLAPDVIVQPKEEAILNALFPARPSFVLPLEWK